MKFIYDFLKCDWCILSSARLVSSFCVQSHKVDRNNRFLIFLLVICTPCVVQFCVAAPQPKFTIREMEEFN